MQTFPLHHSFSLNIEGQSQTVHLTAGVYFFQAWLLNLVLLFWAPHFKQRWKINVCSSKEIQVIFPKHQNILVVAAAALLVVTYIFVSLVTFQNTKVKWPSVRLFGPTVRNTCSSATCAHFWKQVLAFLIFIFSLIEKYHTICYSSYQWTVHLALSFACSPAGWLTAVSPQSHRASCTVGVTAAGGLQCFSCTLNALWAGRPLQLIPAAGGEWVHVLLTELERLWDESGTDEAADVIFIYFICLSESAWYLKWVQKSTFINDSILKKPFLKTRPSSDPLFLHRSCFGTVFLNIPSEPDGTGFFGFWFLQLEVLSKVGVFAFLGLHRRGSSRPSSPQLCTSIVTWS